MFSDLATSITRSASRQTYYTIRFLADQDRVSLAYQAYAYFRWLDDTLDAASNTAENRMAFLIRQKTLLGLCYQGRPPLDIDLQEGMLIELTATDHDSSSGLGSYIRNMMRVMEFDAARRGRLISRMELNEYTRCLSVAVIDAMQYCIGHGQHKPGVEAAYKAVSGAHIIHMLRDTYADVESGYFNIPREVLDGAGIGPWDVHSAPYRNWIKSRIELARSYLKEGREYFQASENIRFRLAGLAYIARFEWLLETIEKEAYLLRAEYSERKGVGTAIKMARLVASALVNPRLEETPAQTISARTQ